MPATLKREHCSIREVGRELTRDEFRDLVEKARAELRRRQAEASREEPGLTESVRHFTIRC